MLHNINKRIETVGKQELPTGDSNPRLYISEGETAVNKIKKIGVFFGYLDLKSGQTVVK